MRQHFIVCGLGRVGWRVLEYLRAAGAPVVVVDNHGSPDDPRLAGISLVAGDCRQPEVLTRAGLAEAKGVLILTSDDLVSLSAALMVRQVWRVRFKAGGFEGFAERIERPAAAERAVREDDGRYN